MIQLAAACGCATRLLQRICSCPSKLYYQYCLSFTVTSAHFSLKAAEGVLLDACLKCKISNLPHRSFETHTFNQRQTDRDRGRRDVTVCDLVNLPLEPLGIHSLSPRAGKAPPPHNRETNKHINTQIQSHVLIISLLIHTFTLSAAMLPPLLSLHLSLRLSLIAASHPSRRLLRLLFLSFSPSFLLSRRCHSFPLSPLLFPSILFRLWRISLMIKQ